MSVQALGVLGGSDVRIDTYIDTYNWKSVVLLVWGSLRLAPISLVLTLTRFALVRMYTQRTYIHV